MAKRTIKQHDITDCGAACLASVSAHFKLKYPIARIRQYAGTDKKGTNIFGLIKASEKLGFSAKGVRGDYSSLFQIPKPSIAHIVVQEKLHHFVVIYRVTKNYVQIMDPAYGKMEKVKTEDFKKQWTGVLVLLTPGTNFQMGDKSISVFKRFWFLLKPHKTVLVQALVGAVLYTILGFSTSIYIQKITDYVLVDANIKLLNLLSIAMLFLLVIKVLIGYFKDVFLIKTGQQIDARLILGYYKHLLQLPQQFFDTMRVGEIMSRIGDAVKIRNFINNVALGLTVNILIVVFSFALMFTYYWKLALIMTLIIPLYLVLYFIVNQLNKKVERRVMESGAELESQLVESLNAVGTIKRFGLEDFSNIKTETRFITLLRNSFTSALNLVFSGVSSGTISQLFVILLLWFGSHYVIQNEITPGELLSFYAIVGYFIGPLSALIGSNKQIQNALIAADRLFEILDLEHEDSGNKFELTLEQLGNIEFQDVCFRYGTRSEILKNFDLTLNRGEVTALVGESGSGKSTLVSLIQNIYPVNSGKISIGEHDLAHISKESLRSIVSVVPQKVDLFSGNVLENIAVGEIEPDFQFVVELCREIGILDCIERLPNGFDTYLGENGATLSGGQKQRIAIARALYKNPEILILDEATSSLDSGSESFVQSAIEKFKAKNKTVILIAHRLSTVVSADRIIVLQSGEVMEQGNHEELIAKKGLYHQLWRQQLPRLKYKLKPVG